MGTIYSLLVLEEAGTRTPCLFLVCFPLVCAVLLCLPLAGTRVPQSGPSAHLEYLPTPITPAEALFPAFLGPRPANFGSHDLRKVWDRVRTNLQNRELSLGQSLNCVYSGELGWGQKPVSHLQGPQFVPPQHGHPAHMPRFTIWFVETLHVRSLALYLLEAALAKGQAGLASAAFRTHMSCVLHGPETQPRIFWSKTCMEN